MAEDPVELWHLRLPGREGRFREPPFDRLEKLIPAAAQGLIEFLSGPFAFYGHSIGAIVAFELARYLRDRHGILPSHLFVAGCPAPHIPWTHEPLHLLPDAALLRRVNDRYQAIPGPVLQDVEFRQLAARALRGDFSLIETYVHTPARPLECPITAFAGADDQTVDRVSIQAWRDHSSSRFQLHAIPGDHFFLESAPRMLLQFLVNALGEMTQDPLSAVDHA